MGKLLRENIFLQIGGVKMTQAFTGGGVCQCIIGCVSGNVGPSVFGA